MSNNNTAKKTDVELLVGIIDKVSNYSYGTEKSPYAQVSGQPITYIHKKHKDCEINVYRVDEEPGCSYFESLYNAFDFIDAGPDIVKFFVDLELYKLTGENPIEDKHIPVMVKLINSVSDFWFDGIHIYGPMVQAGEIVDGMEVDKRPFYSISHTNKKNKKKEPKTYSLAEAFEVVGLTEEAEVLKKYIK